ncbi:MAG: hypothetical protein ACJAZ2_000699 [Glaciecola sp.]
MKPLSFNINILLKQALFIAPVLFMTGAGSCKRTEDDIFSQDEKFEYYQWENHTGVKVFEAPSDFSLPSSELHQLSIKSKDPEKGHEVKIKALFVGNLSNISEDTLIVFCNGAQYHMDYYYEQIKTLYQCGSPTKYNILTFDYQGLGSSPGQTSLEALLQDAEAVGAWLNKNEVPTENIILYGQGLGAVAASFLAADSQDEFNSPPTLILENPVAKTDYLLSNATQLNLPSSFFDQSQFDNIELIKNFKGKLLMLLSEQDEKYSKSINGEEIYKFHSGIDKELHVTNANHQNFVPQTGFLPYCDLISDFIKHTP